MTVSVLSAPPWGITWTEDDTIIYAGRRTGGLLRVPSTGGSSLHSTAGEVRGSIASRRVCRDDEPCCLPQKRARRLDGIRRKSSSRPSTTGERKVLLEGGTDARYVSTGHLVYAHMGTLMAAPFDVEKLEVTGDPVALLDGVAQAVHGSINSLDTGAARFSVSPSGTLAYVPGGVFPEDRRRLVWVDRTGAVEALDAPASAYWSPRLSPDGHRIALYDAEALIYDVRRGALTPLTPGEQSSFPVWTPDGARVVYSQVSSGRARDPYWVPADGSGAPERVLEAEGTTVPGEWTPDGETLVYMASRPDSGSDIWVLSIDGEREPRPLLQGPSNEIEPSLSPDGSWLAYVSASGEFATLGSQDEQSGNWVGAEVWVQPYPGPGARVQISTNGGQEPIWAKDGRELFYRSHDPRQVMAVTIDTSSGLTPSRPRPLFDDPFLRGSRRNYDVAADGRFLMIRREPMELEATNEIHIVQNWTKELEERVVPTR